LKPCELLPHEPPFIFIDTLESVEEGKKGRGVKEISLNDPFVNADGIMPPVFLVEAMAQLSGLVSGRRTGGVLSAIKEMKFLSSVRAGSRLVLQSEFEIAFGGLYVFSCEAFTDGEKKAEGRVIHRLLD